MEFFNPYCIPAAVALGLKVLLLWATRVMPLKNTESRIFLAFLFVLALHNVSEIMMFNYSGPKTGVIPLRAGFLYYTMGTIAMAVLLHLMLARLKTSTGWDVPVRRYPWLIYFPAAIVLLMLWTTDSMVKGFVPYGFSYTHVPGPLYVWFELYALVYLVASIVVLGISTVFSINRTYRRKNLVTLLGMAPIIVLPIVVIVLQAVGLNVFNLLLWFPVALAVFLIVTAYAIYEDRLFDVFFHLPGTRLHSRRTRFHESIKDFISELDRLPSISIEEALNRLASTLKCSVALVSAGKTPLQAHPLAGGSRLDFEHLREGELEKIDDIVLTKELKRQDPQTYSILSGANCAAVLPFRPFKGTSAGWLLLGGSRQAPDELPIDFAMVESLFDCMGNLFLDNIVKEREQLTALQTQIEQMMSANEDLKAKLERKQETIDVLYDQLAVGSESPASNVRLDELTTGLETKVICDTLAKTNGNVSATAKALGVTRQTLYAKMDSYGIDKKKWRLKPSRRS